jgi:hypothetical protein
LPVLLLGPALLPGYVLSYDMVWVPHLALRSDFLGLGPGVPRAVPSDAVVALVDNLIPAQVLQKLVLYGALLLVGLGASRLVNGSVVARCVAISVAVWNPFVVERLRMGHWPVLLGYAVLPWLVVLVRRARTDGRVPLPLFASESSGSEGLRTGSGAGCWRSPPPRTPRGSSPACCTHPGARAWSAPSTSRCTPRACCRRRSRR